MPAKAEQAALGHERRWVDLRTLKPHPQNSRVHDRRQLDVLKASLVDYGWVKPLAQAGDVLYSGHGMHTAAAELARQGGCPRGQSDPWLVPVVDIAALTEAERLRYLVADNRSSDLSTFDEDALIQNLSAIAETDFDLSRIGYSDDEMKGLLGELNEAEEPVGIADAPLSPTFWIAVSGPFEHQAAALSALKELAKVEGIEVQSNLRDDV